MRVLFKLKIYLLSHHFYRIYKIFSVSFPRLTFIETPPLYAYII